MKIKLLTFLLLFLPIGVLCAESKNDVVIHPTSSESTQGGNKPSRSPIRIPSVSIEEYTLYFDSSCIGCTVQLLQDDTVVYSDIVDEDGEVQLPVDLIGTYQLQFKMGSITFVGEIEL